VVFAIFAGIMGIMIDKDRTLSIMAIVNLTDDSFFSGNRFLGADICKLAERALDEGAEIIDLGACSTRPGSAPVSWQKEWARLEPVLMALKESGILSRRGPRLSIDTFRVSIARRAYELIGDFIINDVSGGKRGMIEFAAEKNLEYIATSPVPAGQVYDFFRKFEARASKAGLKSWILDPGFGFGKVLQDNWTLLENLEPLRSFGKPLLIGISRKSFIYKPLGLTPETCLKQTGEAHIKALRNGGDILRVHDVAAAAQIISSYKASTSQDN